VKQYFDYKDQRLEFELVHRKRRSIEIQIDESGIRVIAPVGVSPHILQQVLQDKGDWILSKLAILKNRKTISHTFTKGDRILYLGKEYELEVRPVLGRPYVELGESTITVSTSRRDPEDVKRTLETWYKKQAKELARSRAEHYRKILDVQPVEVKISSAKKRWGSCSPKGNILINWRLVMAPPWVFDYVVAHEMCHLIEMNHSKDFWQLVERAVPHYKKVRDWLKENGYKLKL
jgi:predicted metal-dependent hydrolase